MTESTSEFVRSRVEALGLMPHPEGGWYREVYRSGSTLPLPRGERSLLTVIHYVLPPGGFSAWHRVRADEGWTWVGGDPIELHQLRESGEHRVATLSGALPEGPTAVVPAGDWQAASTTGTLGAHAICTVAPGFDFRDFRMATRRELLARFPHHGALVERFTATQRLPEMG